MATRITKTELYETDLVPIDEIAKRERTGWAVQQIVHKKGTHDAWLEYPDKWVVVYEKERI